MPEERRSESAQRTLVCCPPDRALKELAARQHGVVARAHVLAAGVTPSKLKRMVASGRLIALHRGVYAVGHAQLRREGWWLAAVLAVGPGAVLSHRDAAALHGILPPSNRRAVDVTTTARGRTGKERIDLHRTAVLDSLDVTTLNRIPATTVPRTLVDLAAVLPQERTTKAIAEADRLGKLDVRALHAAAERTRGRRGPGHARIATALDILAANEPPLTRSELEDRFLIVVVERHGLPRPRTNAPIDTLVVDALWPAARLVVELDGYASHRGRQAFQRDRDRGNELTAKGYTLLRFTYADVTRWPHATAEKIRKALTRACESAPPPRAAARPA
jgi:very-short-patch-repair endonuclease